MGFELNNRVAQINRNPKHNGVVHVVFLRGSGNFKIANKVKDKAYELLFRGTEKQCIEYLLERQEGL